METLLHLTEFVPHKVCWLMRDDIIFTHAVGDSLTAIAYYFIPVALFYATRKFTFDWSLTFIFCVYGVFILLCGSTHVMDVLMIWKINEPIIVIDGWLRVLTGIVSWFAAGVTVWAFQIFFMLIGNLLRVYNKMDAERRKFGRVSDETYKQHNEILERAKAYLHQREEVL